ncbi:MAG: hypothetical protein ACYC99_14825 [Candidatus Geothermincolia bacterium]
MEDVPAGITVTASSAAIGRGSSRTLGTLGGALYLCGILLAGLFVTFILFSIAFAFSYFHLSPWCFYVAFAVMPVIPFFMGMLGDRVHWLLGLTYAVAFLFIGMPVVLQIKYSSYVWFLGDKFSKGYIAIPVVLILSPLLAWAGESLIKSRNVRVFTFEKPYLSIVLLIVLVVLVSAIIPVTEGPSFGLGKMFESKEYKFRIKVPAGWSTPIPDHNPSYLESNPKPLVMFNTEYLDLNRETYRQGGHGNYVSISIAVFDQIPYTGGALGGSDEEIYDRLVAALALLYQTKQWKNSSLTVSNKEDVNVAGKKGVSLMFRDFGAPDTGYQADVYVSRKPYLYRLSFGLYCPVEQQHEIYKDMLNSFQFID